jgi:hypothetical protein
VIEVSENALDAHTRTVTSPDRGQTAANCPAGTSDDRKVRVCHATGSSTNPFVVIEVSENALRHTAHGDKVLTAGQTAANCPAARRRRRSARPAP